MLRTILSGLRAGNRPALLLLSTTALITACHDGRDVLAPAPAVPTPDPTVPTPPVPTPPVPTSNTAIAGVYDLTAAIASFDPAWGDLTGYRYTAILVFRRDPSYPPEIGGTFSDFRLTGPGGQEDGVQSGTITSYFDKGRPVIELVAEYFHFTLFPAGDLRGSVIEGTFFQGGHIGGPFTAERRQEE